MHFIHYLIKNCAGALRSQVISDYIVKLGYSLMIMKHVVPLMVILLSISFT